MRRNTFLANAFGWIGTPLIIAYWILGAIAYIWSIFIAFNHYGILGSIITLLFPVVGQVYWVIKLWGQDGYSSFIAVCSLAFITYVASKIFIFASLNYERKARENNEPVEVEKRELYGFGGWLVIVTIGQLFSVYYCLVNIFETDLPSIRNWHAIVIDASGPYVNLLYSVLWVELIGSILFLLIILSVAYLTIKLHRHYKYAQIGYLALTFFYSIVVMLLMLKVNTYDDSIYPEPYKAFIQAIVQAAIWIPYFLVSKRVKNTFNQ